jgi:deoxyadenosine/deoxycytidine kinase
LKITIIFSDIKNHGSTARFINLFKSSVPTLVGQIQKEVSEYEENIRLDYLKKLNEYYNKWIDGYKEGQLANY